MCSIVGLSLTIEAVLKEVPGGMIVDLRPDRNNL